MSYKYSKGAQVIGDLKAADDAERNTQIDFEEDEIKFDTGGSTRLTVDNTTITTTVPIHISGSVTEGLRIAKAGADYREIQFETNGVDTAFIQVDASEGMIIGCQSDNDEIIFMTKESGQGIAEVARMTAAGRLGIKETNPSKTLDVGGDAFISGTIQVGDITLPNTDGTSGQVLKTDGSGSVSWQDESGGGGSPAGSNTEIQYNDNGSFGASTNLTYDGTTLTIDGELQIDGEIKHNNFVKTSYPSNITNTGSYAMQKSFVKEFMYAKYDWSDSSAVDLFSIEPYDERTSSPYAGSNIWAAVGVEITAVGHYKGAGQGNLFSKVIGVIHWSGGSRSGLSTTNLSVGADPSTWFSVANTGSLGQTLKFQYNVGSWNDGPGMIHIKVYTGYAADDPAVNDDGRYLYWVLTEHFNEPSE